MEMQRFEAGQVVGAGSSILSLFLPTLGVHIPYFLRVCGVVAGGTLMVWPYARSRFLQRSPKARVLILIYTAFFSGAACVGCLAALAWSAHRCPEPVASAPLAPALTKDDPSAIPEGLVNIQNAAMRNDLAGILKRSSTILDGAKKVDFDLQALLRGWNDSDSDADAASYIRRLEAIRLEFTDFAGNAESLISSNPLYADQINYVIGQNGTQLQYTILNALDNTSERMKEWSTIQGRGSPKMVALKQMLTIQLAAAEPALSSFVWNSQVKISNMWKAIR